MMKTFKFDLQRFVAQDKQSVHSGNTIFLKVAGTIIGRAQSLDGRRSFGTEGVYEIGSIMPQEHVNNRYEGTVSLERFLIKKTDLAKAGFAALGEEILTRDIIDIEVISKLDDGNDQTVRVYRGCTCVDYSETFRVGAIAGENATFQYLSSDRGNSDAETINSIYNELGKAYRNAFTDYQDSQYANSGLSVKASSDNEYDTLTYLSDYELITKTSTDGGGGQGQGNAGNNTGNNP